MGEQEIARRFRELGIELASPMKFMPYDVPDDEDGNGPEDWGGRVLEDGYAAYERDGEYVFDSVFGDDRLLDLDDPATVDAIARQVVERWRELGALGWEQGCAYGEHYFLVGHGITRRFSFSDEDRATCLLAALEAAAEREGE